MRKAAKKLICLFLVLSMLAGMGIFAFADSNYYDYEKYMCVGDSIAAGCALTKDGSETFFDQTAEYSDYVFGEDYIYRGQDYAAVPNAYHSIVADALDAELLQCARSGMRAVELRYWLDGIYNEYDADCTWGNTFFDNDGNGFSLQDLDALNEQVNYIEMIKEADLITINLGSNDVFSYTFSVVLEKLTSDTSIPLLNTIKTIFEETGNIGKAFGMLIDFCQSTGKIAYLLATLVDTFDNTIKQYKENYNAIMSKIYELNPGVTVVNVGVFNPLRYIRLSSDSSLDISLIVAGIVTELNNLYKDYTTKYVNCYYAAVPGTETYKMSLDEPLVWDYFILKVHPTIAGHRYMANQILKALPSGNYLPFNDVSALSWYYDDVLYCYNSGLMRGVSARSFEPESVSTREELVTVLYRLAGSPDVSGMSEPFIDVTNRHWSRDAIVWAYNSGIVYGTSKHFFEPSDPVTREQFVTILYRFAGCPQVEGRLEFKDVKLIDDCYKDAVLWASQNGLVKGYEDGTFRGGMDISRAEMAAILARYCRNYIA